MSFRLPTLALVLSLGFAFFCTASQAQATTYTVTGNEIRLGAGNTIWLPGKKIVGGHAVALHLKTTPTTWRTLRRLAGRKDYRVGLMVKAGVVVGVSYRRI